MSSPVRLTGGAYTAHNVIASAQRSLNLYSEPMPQGEGEPAPAANYPTPGTRLLGAVGTGPIRCIRQASNGNVYVVSGDNVYSVDATTWVGTSLGSLTAGLKTPVSMVDNGLDMLIVDGSANGWAINLAANTMAPVVDPTGMFVGADRVDYLDTFFLLNKPGTPQFYISGSLALTFDPLDFANKEAYSDLLVTLIVARREVYLLGQKTSEIWYDVGASSPTDTAAFQFAPVQGVFVDHGCVAKYSAASYDNTVFWLSRNRQGRGVVMTSAGYQTKRVSTYAIEAELQTYPRIDDAIGFCYQIDGHTMYVLTFPHADHTWCYDVGTGEWHEWAWIDSNGDEHRHRANAFWPVNDLLVVGDWQNGNLYALEQTAFTDNGNPIKRVRTYPHLITDARRVFYREFIADMDVGNAPETSVFVPAIPGRPGGFIPLPLMASGGRVGVADAVSADGLTACGYVSPPSDDTFRASCYWTSASGDWTDVVGPVVITNPDPDSGDYSEAFACSGDGSIIVGVGLSSLVSGGAAFKWTAADGVVLVDTTRSQALGISADGSCIVGYVDYALAPDGINFLAQACYWDSVTLTRTYLGFLSGHNYSQAIAASSDGSVIVGYSQIGIFGLATTRAWRWTAATGMVDLGLPAGAGATFTTVAFGNCVSGDGSLVSGSYGTSGAGGAWTWTEAGGFVIAPLDGGVSSDGATIVSSVTDSSSGTSLTNLGYMSVATSEVTVPTPVPWGGSDPLHSQTQGTGISADGQTMSGSSVPTATTNYLPFVYRIPIAPSPGSPFIAEDNLISLRWSDDRGHSYGSLVSQPIGATGEYRKSLQWQRCGLARDRVWELSWSTPMATALQGAWITAEVADADTPPKEQGEG